MSDFIERIFKGLVMLVSLFVVSAIFNFLGILALVSSLIGGGTIGIIELIVVFAIFAYIIGWLVEEIGGWK